MVSLSPLLWRNIATEKSRAGRPSNGATIADLSADAPDNGVLAAGHVTAP
jgi:hypothetical protein